MLAVPVYGIFASNGIFIWWPKIENINVSSYVIQFQSDEATSFRHIVGTTRNIDEVQTWSDISPDLTDNIPVTINDYPNSENEENPTKPTSTRKKTASKRIVELRVNGNVSGILIPNTHVIVVRVLVPIADENGELHQDTRYVEWTKVRASVHFKYFYIIYNLNLKKKTLFQTD